LERIDRLWLSWPPKRHQAKPGRETGGRMRSVGARADDVGKGKKDTGYLYKALMVARWWGCERIPPQVSTGNRTRATIKALPAAPHLPRPYGW